MKIQSVHPFPARMASSIVWNRLPKLKTRLRILDPMAGSGTTLVNTKIRGHIAYGCDTDPLALLIARVWCHEYDPVIVKYKAKLVLHKAKILLKSYDIKEAYPKKADNETKEFIDYWFDKTSRLQLNVLSNIISKIRNEIEKDILWCALSRLIITKKTGVSLAMDVSHSRPHKVYNKSPVNPFDKFIYEVEYILKRMPFINNNHDSASAHIFNGDARDLPINTNSINMVITSPPYFNAIDYLRGHKMSLVWMGYSINQLRNIRSNNIGSEKGCICNNSSMISNAIDRLGEINKLKNRHKLMLYRYINDLWLIVKEIRRVLTPDGKAIFVIGNSSITETFINNSKALTYLAINEGFKLLSRKERPIPENRRYLPPPTINNGDDKIRKRMRNEIILTFGSP